MQSSVLGDVDHGSGRMTSMLGIVAMRFSKASSLARSNRTTFPARLYVNSTIRKLARLVLCLLWTTESTYDLRQPAYVKWALPFT